ncbi:MAG TPA: hypothetical protein VLV78_12965 [Thermoanaerobaculia bacterium]|nr:hypothetical protein [Thermoanaerobaculia bacterium]
MIRKLALTLAMVFVAGSLFGNTTLFSKYEDLRKALVDQSLVNTRSASASLATAAKAAGQADIASRAIEVNRAADLARARVAFSALSESMIRMRNAAKGARPAVYYCSMEKKSWLQAKGTVGNPYVDKSMTSCGELNAD